MKKSVKKMQLKKRSISVLNASEVKGGIVSIGPSFLCQSVIYDGEDNCVSFPPNPNQR